MWEHLPQPCQKGPALTSVNQCQKVSGLTLGDARNQYSMMKGSTLTSNNQCHKCLALIFNHARNQSFMLKGLCTHILSCRNQSYSHMKWPLVPDWAFLVTDQVPPFQEWHSTLTSDHVGTNPIVTSEWLSVPDWAFLVTDQVPPFQEWNSSLTSDHVGNNPTATSEWIITHIWHGRNQSSYHDRMAQPLHLSIEGT